MMKLKKMSALVLAIMMMAAAGAAWAEDPSAAGDYLGSEDSKTAVAGSKIPLAKTIVFFNPEGSSIREPDITYTYTITPAAVDTETVTDKDGDTARVNPGIKDASNATKGVSPSVTISFSPQTTDGGTTTDNTHAAAATGTPVVKTADITVTPADFPHAGIYRYQITETSSPAVTAAGLEARDSDSYSNIRYLDVYISNGTSGLELTGAVIFKTNTSLYGKEDTENNIAVTTDKTIGFDVASTSPTDGDYDNDTSVDRYHTYNVEVTKKTTGSLADKTFDFPFEVTATGTLTQEIIADVAMTGGTYQDGSTTTCPATITVSTTAATLKPQLSDGDSIKITGLPTGTTVSVKEKNTSIDQYTASAKFNNTPIKLRADSGTAGVDEKKMAAGTGTAELNAAQAIATKTAKDEIEVTNTLSEISPTGYVVRYAPYALILLAGVILLVIARKHRKNTDEE